MFSQKLNFLMQLTNTKNSVLGMAIHVDPSTISRLRSGKRELPKHQNFLDPACLYFAKKIKDGYQKKAASDEICPGKEWPDDIAWAAELIFGYLSSSDTKNAAVEKFLSKMSYLSLQNNFSAFPKTEEKNLSVPIYNYGNEGKRQAVIGFLNTVINAPAPRTLLLFSDENMSWMYEDSNFVKMWSSLLYQVIEKGNRIKIIHTINRSLGEMIEALDKWIPIYMTGMVEPYYYPRLRDGLFQKTLFVATSLTAVLSSSVKGHTENNLSLYINNQTAVEALEKEFLDYFILCRPLMQIFKTGSGTHFWKLYLEMEAASGNATLMHKALSLFTMPEWVAKNLNHRSKAEKLMHLRGESFRSFEKSIKNFTITELIRLPNVQEVIDGKIVMPLTKFSDLEKTFYTCEEYKAHLKNALLFSQKYENYNIHVTKDLMNDMLVYCKEGSGVIIAQEALSTIFAFNEPGMTSAFDQYLSKEQSRKTDNKKSQQQIQGFLNSLEKQNL